MKERKNKHRNTAVGKNEGSHLTFDTKNTQHQANIME